MIDMNVKAHSIAPAITTPTKSKEIEEEKIKEEEEDEKMQEKEEEEDMPFDIRWGDEVARRCRRQNKLSQTI
jgi:ribosomal protein L12E/L44/L45/RPP1/RPP2